MKSIEEKIKELQDLKRMRDELDDAIETATDAVKEALSDTEEMNVGPWKVTWRTVTSNRLDTTALKKDLPDIAARYTKTSTSRPLRII